MIWDTVEGKVACVMARHNIKTPIVMMIQRGLTVFPASVAKVSTSGSDSTFVMIVMHARFLELPYRCLLRCAPFPCNLIHNLPQNHWVSQNLHRQYYQNDISPLLVYIIKYTPKSTPVPLVGSGLRCTLASCLNPQYLQR